MRQFPTGSRYVDALQNTTLCFSDRDLRGARPKLDKLGRPKPISGNFASVFELTSADGSRYAVKCFTREVPDQERRYQAISDHLATVGHSWKVGFEYLAQGILVSGQRYPILKMEWVSGISLTRWVEDHLHDTAALKEIADRFAELSGQLSAAGIAHGDLQHGNLLVAPGGSLRLVDYDGMYVPALAGLAPAEKGHRNYQSPRRADTDFGPELDRFSSWLIYLSLVALAADPALWHQMHEPGGEYLLLDGSDFENPSASLRMPALLAHHSDQVRELAEQVRNQLGLPLSQLPELSAVAATVAAPAPPPPPAAPPPRATSGPLPDWMAGHVPSTPPRPPVSFAGSRPFFRTALCLLSVACAGLLALFGLPGVAAAVALASSGTGFLTLFFRRRAEAVDKRRARTHLAENRARFAGPRRELARLERERDGFEKTAAVRVASFTSRQNDLQKRQQDELARIERRLQRRLSGIIRGLGDLSSRRNRELANELRQIQDQYLHAQLARIRITPGQISGIGKGAVEKLSWAGITTAADFVGVRLVTGSGSYGNTIAFLQLARGGEIRVDGIGEVKATSLRVWREAHAQSARLTQPTVLPPDRQKVIVDRFAAQEGTLKAEQTTVQSEANAQRQDLAAQVATDRAALLAEQRRAENEIATRRADINRGIADLRASTSVGLAQLQNTEKELARYRRITFVRFLAFALMGR
ncbi:hypothetical protein [Actinoallomurus vinaceus]